MGVRLYESAWVVLRNIEQPVQVRKDRANPALFHAGAYKYDIDGRPYFFAEPTPDIVEVLSLSAARARGLSTTYNGALSEKY